MFEKRLSIFTGHFGSGKTEVAVNYALKMSAAGNKTAIVDFDIVNPYFRTADAKETLEKQGIWVITPMYANTNVDVPALPPEIYSLFQKKEYKAVLDVGGDDLGARAVARFREEIQQDDYEMFFVVNVKRPMTDTLEKIEEMIYSIESSAGMKVTKLVNNTNLLQYTSFEDIVEGQEKIFEISNKLGVPMGFTTCMGIDCHTLKEKVGNEVLTLDKLIKLPWDRE
ncbi:MAG: hypothetical protein N2484_01845 [Clostridia bacterium]|nr:hypothetical protein [Clostridia bacterium]